MLASTISRWDTVGCQHADRCWVLRQTVWIIVGDGLSQFALLIDVKEHSNSSLRRRLVFSTFRPRLSLRGSSAPLF
jgi:hypothetical protein